MIKQFNSNIIYNKEIAKDYYELSFKWNKEAGQPSPGQFITIKCSDTSSPLLRRPFALSYFNEKTLESKIIYQKRGESTKLLSSKSENEQLDIIGPLGNSFPLTEAHTPILIAGGIGIGPMLFAYSKFLKEGITPILIIGTRTMEYMPNVDEINNFNTVFCTDDGSLGHKGTVIDYINKNLDVSNCVFYTCGPHPMMASASKKKKKKHIDCWVSMEQTMACGVGACMGCVIEIESVHSNKNIFARVCKDGPIFNSKDVKWN